MMDSNTQGKNIIQECFRHCRSPCMGANPSEHFRLGDLAPVENNENMRGLTPEILIICGL